MTTEGYLQAMLTLRQQNPSMLLKDYEYSSIEDFVLREGQRFDDVLVNHAFQWGEMKMCFSNAADLALRMPGLTYVEGYACSVIPTMHAWCVDADDRVIDITWDMHGEYAGHDYFGVKFPTDLLGKLLIRYKQYGLLDNWEERWPLLRKSFAETKREFEEMP